MRKKLKELKPVPNGVERLECCAGRGEIISCLQDHWERVGLGGGGKHCMHVWRRKAKEHSHPLFMGIVAEKDTNADNLIASGTILKAKTRVVLRL